jgi:hypothetical protein
MRSLAVPFRAIASRAATIVEYKRVANQSELKKLL